MEKIKKCLNEWNAIVEGLGQGKQTILIRKYSTTINKFLLYPTSSYIIKENYLDSFEKRCKNFVELNALPKKEDNKSEVKYYAEIKRIIETTPQIATSLNRYHMWSNEHIKSYLQNQKAFIWILRVFKLENPIMSKRTMGLKYANLRNEITLESIKPVLSDSDFSKILRDLEIKLI